MKHCLPVTTFSQKTYNIYNTTQYCQTYRAHLCSSRIENNEITSNFREETIFDSKSLSVYTGRKAIFAANKDFYRKSWNQFHVVQKHRLKEARDRNATMLLHYISLGDSKSAILYMWKLIFFNLHYHLNEQFKKIEIYKKIILTIHELYVWRHLWEIKELEWR